MGKHCKRLGRRHGQDGVMKVRVAEKAFKRDMAGLPRESSESVNVEDEMFTHSYE